MRHSRCFTRRTMGLTAAVLLAFASFASAQPVTLKDRD